MGCHQRGPHAQGLVGLAASLPRGKTAPLCLNVTPSARDERTGIASAIGVPRLLNRDSNATDLAINGIMLCRKAPYSFSQPMVKLGVGLADR